MRHSYKTSNNFTDQGSQFTSRMLDALSTILEFKIEVSTVKIAQTIGDLERSQVALNCFYEHMKSNCQKIGNIILF